MAETKLPNVYQRLQKARIEFASKELKKTGVNKYSEYTYFQLSDIVKPAQEVCATNGLLVLFSVPSIESAMVEVINVDDPSDTIVLPIPFIVPESAVGATSGKAVNNATQQLGGAITYERRYAWMIVMDIVENDDFDATSGKPEINVASRPATPEKREEAKEKVIAINDQAPKPMITTLKRKLKQLKEQDSESQAYVDELGAKTDNLKKISKAECEQYILEINTRLEEIEASVVGE